MPGESRPPLAIEFRPARASDEGLFYQPWIRTLQRAEPWSRLDPNYHSASCHALITSLMSRSTCTCAVDPSDDSQIFGVIVYGHGAQGGLLHWVYTKDLFRRALVASRLVDLAFQGEPAHYTIKTPAIRHYEDKWNISFRSYGLFGR